jgi:hypothetical protein
MSSLARLSLMRSRWAIAAFAASLTLAALPSGSAFAQGSDIFAPGQPVLTGFPGVVALDEVPDGSDPLDYTFIDLEGYSLVIQQLLPDAPPEGQLIETSSEFGVSAADLGLVFSIAHDDAPETTGADAPNLYLAATSAYGLHIVKPDADGNTMRTRTGDPDAEFMAGQWGNADGITGYPGSIWKVDGVTGEVSLFTTIAANSGPSLGDIVFDSGSQQFFVSDLDTGLIYRLALDGTILDTFDHGVDGRPEHDLDPVEDDGVTMDVTDPAFDTEDPSTWGFTQPERRVNGMTVENGRLYYTALEPQQVYSARINDDGSLGVPRWEFDITDLAAPNEFTSIAFDSKGRLVMAQRGATTGVYDYSALTQVASSAVVRYEREFPDDPDTTGIWVETADSYAIGVAEPGNNAAGGLAFGYGYDDVSGAFDGACGITLWATGDSLRDNADLDPPLDGPAYVAGLQGVPRSWVRPLNDPSTLSAFTDFDGNTGDDQALLAGHVGDVAMWEPCEIGDIHIDPDEPEFLPPDDYVPPPTFNLTTEKWASPFKCFDGGANWWCSFTIRVENTGDVPYWGPITIEDHLPANNPGASMVFWPTPPWACGPTGPTSYECSRGPVLLFPGDGVTLKTTVKLPKALVDYCHIANVAGVTYPFGFHDDDPSDDYDVGVASIAAPGCVPPGGGTDLLLKKVAAPWCFDAGATWNCSYVVTVQNAGPGNYSGPIQVKDTLDVNVPATVLGPWACAQAGPVLTCNINAPPVNVPPGWTSGFLVTAKVPKGPGSICELANRANISNPVGGPSNAVAGNDFDDATAKIPSLPCFVPQPKTDLQAKKQGLGCGPFFGGWACQWKITITNVGPDPYLGSLSFKDTSTGAVGNSLPGVAPYCAGTPANVTCNPIGPVFYAPGVPHSLTFITAYNNGPSVCSATNTLTIVDPSPGSAQNPAGNDSATLNQVIPNPACAGLPVVNIIKTAKGCAADPSSTDWLCKFEIKVKNVGGAQQPGPIVFKDFNDKPTTFNTPACVPTGMHWTCTRPNPLNVGATWTVQATTRVDPLSVSVADCNVLNSVWITNPLNADPGHFSQAQQKVPQLFVNVGPGPVMVYCDPPSIALEKTATKTVESGDGYDATFRIKVTSTGPDPYNGTVELEEDLPLGTSYVSSSWPCVPTIDNNVHCSSPYKTLPVGTYTTMSITIHIPEDVAVESKCNVVNVVNAAIAAEVLHADEGLSYTASAAAKLPASLCREEEEEPEPEPEQCPINQVMPNGGCCEAGEVWNGRQCAEPRPVCPEDSHINNAGRCVCDEGTTGRPGQCEEENITPACPEDSFLNNAGRCVCDRGTEGRPGSCEPIEEEPEEPVCPRDSVLNNAGECVCKRGTEGFPGFCEDIVEAPVCPKDSVLNNRGDCVCARGTQGEPGECKPIIIIQICPDDSVLSNSGQCVCKRGTEGEPGNCQKPEPEPEKPIQTVCPDDSVLNSRGQCVCKRGTTGKPGACRIELNLDLPVIKLN